MTVPQRKVIGDLVEVYDSQAEQEAIARIIEPRYTAMLTAMHELVAATFPEMEAFRLDDAATRRLLTHAARRVVMIDTATREAVAEMLLRGQTLGLSNWELANGSPKDNYPGIQGLFEQTYKNRALTVARNELLEAQHWSSLDRYVRTGLVDRVQLRDGTGAAPDQPCVDRNGTVVPLSSHPQRLHVNCSVVVLPILRGDPSPPASNVPPVVR